MNKKDWIVSGGAIGATVLAGVLKYAFNAETAVFIVSALALAGLAALVGTAVDQLEGRLSPGAVGALHAGLGNLPELLIGLFALNDGLVEFVQASLIGSILANQLFVLGMAFLLGGLRHGTLRFTQQAPRLIATLMLLAVGALIIPSLAFIVHSPAATHEQGLSIAIAIILLLVFVASIPFSVAGEAEETEGHVNRWSLGLAVGVLVITAVGAALVSDWFVGSLEHATSTLHISQGFTGLVIVAIAGNAVENVVGVQLMWKNKTETGVSVILQSPLQIALALIPALVLLSWIFGLGALTLVFSPLLLASLAVGTLVVMLVVADGEAVWLEGAALMGVYAVIAACFWWG